MIPLLAMIIFKAMVPKFAVYTHTHYCCEMDVVCLADCAFLSEASNLLRAISTSDVITRFHRELYVLHWPHFDHFPDITYSQQLFLTAVTPLSPMFETIKETATALVDAVNVKVPGGRWQLFEFCDLRVYVL